MPQITIADTRTTAAGQRRLRFPKRIFRLVRFFGFLNFDVRSGLSLDDEFSGVRTSSLKRIAVFRDGFDEMFIVCPRAERFTKHRDGHRQIAFVNKRIVPNPV